ncbi:MAG: tyrosine-protein phosphatase [Deltaproteobacteria bacterium]|nr:tyrosine-protein phosphatase [Deltaproteobacteria bacterium]
MALDKKARLAGIVVEQADEKRFSIRWDAVATDDIIRVFAGDSPATIDKHTPVAETRGGDSVEITLPQPIDNPYFEIVKDGGKGLVWALRQLPLEKTCNFRDIGGYRTKDNRRMRWGQVFRSPHLAMLTDNDHNLMHRIGIKLVCDFRTQEEAAAQPDRLPKDGSMEYLPLPIFHGKYDPAEAFECIKQ